MFSKELREMDQNTVKYMIEEQQEQIEGMQEQIEKQQDHIESLQEDNRIKDEELQKLRSLLAEKE